MDSQIEIKRYDYNWKEIEPTIVLARSVGESASTQNMVDILDQFVNTGMKGFETGKNIGVGLQTHHRTLQASVFRLAMGIIVGLSQQEYTDGRNETPVATAKKIAQMIDQGDLLLGRMI